MAELQTAENDLRNQIAERRAEPGPATLEIISLENRLRGIQERLEQETARALRGFEADLEVAQAQEQARRAGCARQKPRTRAIVPRSN